MTELNRPSKSKRFVPPMHELTRQSVESIADALMKQREDLIPNPDDLRETLPRAPVSEESPMMNEDLHRWNILTPDLLQHFYTVREQHRPLDRIIKSLTKEIKSAMVDVVYYTRDGWEVILGEQPRQILDRDRLIRDYRDIYDLCQRMTIARILDVVPPKHWTQ